MPSRSDLRQLLRDQFGHDVFRPGQERIIRNLLAGRDVMAVLPTGAGKSLPFQLAAQLLPGPTLVVSPLIALMKDQAESLEERGVEAGVLNSTQTAGALRENLENAQEGISKLLYVTPERFENAEFLETARGMGVSLLVVDEAHCVSEWGYDFRPAYLALRTAAAAVGRPPILALTATATPWVRSDIIERLGLRDPDVVVHGVDRPNLFLEVRSVQFETEDYRVLRSLFEGEGETYPREWEDRLRRTLEGSGIVYTGTTKAAEETAGWLREWGIPADFYHGQRKKADRERVQDGFMSGELRVIAATNAFGLGIDKPDVRFVIHRDVPASLEEYYQEAGRAGRDGELARTVLLFRAGDLGRAAFLSASSRLTDEEVERAAEGLAPGEELSLPELAQRSGLSRPKLRRILELFARQGLVELSPGSVRRLDGEFDLSAFPLEGEEHRREYERSRLQMMRGYAELWECRRGYLLSYFGQEPEPERCGHCDNDLRLDRAAPEADAAPYQPGSRVRHPEWGEGCILDVSAETLTVRFDREGEKKLGLAFVEENGLLDVIGREEASPPEEALPFNPGQQVVHSEYGPGEVQRAAGESVTVLFEKAGYRTLDAATVAARGLMTEAEE